MNDFSRNFIVRILGDLSIGHRRMISDVRKKALPPIALPFDWDFYQVAFMACSTHFW